MTFEAAEEPPSPPRGGAATRRSAQHGRPVAAALPPPPAGAPRRGVPPPAGGGPASATRGAASTKRAAPAGRSLRASSGRQSSGELKGKPSFAELVESGFMQPGAYRFTVGTQDIHAALEPDGELATGLWGPACWRMIMARPPAHRGELNGSRPLQAAVNCAWGSRQATARGCKGRCMSCKGAPQVALSRGALPSHQPTLLRIPCAGTIVYGGVRYRAISKFALVVLRERNPSRQVRT